MYDKDGNKTSFTNSDGDQTTYSYDAANLQIGETGLLRVEVTPNVW